MLRAEAALAIAQQNPAHFNRRVERQPETNTAKKIHSESFFERVGKAFINAVAHIAGVLTRSKNERFQLNNSSVESFSSLEEAKIQVVKDLTRSIKFDVNGVMVTAGNAPDVQVAAMQQQFIESGISFEEQTRIFNMLHQGLFGSASKAMYPEETALLEDSRKEGNKDKYTFEQIQAATQHIFIAQGFAAPITIDGQSYSYNPGITTGYSIDTRAKTVVGHRLIEMNQELAGVRGAPKSLYQKVTYNYETNTLAVERLSTNAFPARFEVTT
jgi:hypothetical protein